ncbi:hypothetical protein A5893_11410 [Pedobacter psychrophilus]|uniref:Carboxypeptidase-like regulatory domain-containing protein n=1 Tax=Pedobacter psychrophilus TaxID=1826909 RepID=A0A179DDZ9_9SPHI|nr:hypothetical protein [Pedobacter psychrophilus]OAQ39266.1 hypothetical protein A5893_11410 [Pedobacter psychrophilus]
MIRLTFLISIFLILGVTTFAQDKILLKGLVFEIGNKRINNASIFNKKSKETSFSDDFGNFSINVSIGDTLVFTKDNYQEQEKVILQKQNLIIYLKKAITLNEVVIKQQTRKAEQKEILNGYRSKGVYYGGKPPIFAYIFTPLTALHELLGKDAADARRFGSYIYRENAQSGVDTHFNVSIIKESIQIKDEEMVEFMYLYRPKPEDVTYRNRYDDMNYIKKSYQVYLKTKKDRL